MVAVLALCLYLLFDVPLLSLQPVGHFLPHATHASMLSAQGHLVSCYLCLEFFLQNTHGSLPFSSVIFSLVTLSVKPYLITEVKKDLHAHPGHIQFCVPVSSFPW